MLLRVFLMLSLLSWPLAASSAQKNLWKDYYRAKFETELTASTDSGTVARQYRELFSNDKQAFRDFYPKVYGRLDNGKLRAETLEFACDKDSGNCPVYVHEASKLTNDHDQIDKLLTNLYLENFSRNKDLFLTAFPDVYAAVKNASQRNEILETACRIDKIHSATYLQVAIEQKSPRDDNEKLLLSLLTSLISTNKDAFQMLYQPAFNAVGNFQIRSQLLINACNSDHSNISHYFGIALKDRPYANNQFSAIYDLYKTFIKNNNPYFNQMFATFYTMIERPDQRQALLEYSCSNDRNNCQNFLQVAIENRLARGENEKFLFSLYQQVLTINASAYKGLFEKVFASFVSDAIKTELLNFSCSRDIRNCSYYLASALNDSSYAESHGIDLLAQFKKTIKSDPAYYKENYEILYKGTNKLDLRLDLLEYSCNNDKLNCWYYIDVAMKNRPAKGDYEKDLLSIYKSLLRFNRESFKSHFQEVFVFIKNTKYKSDLFIFACENDLASITYYLDIVMQDSSFAIDNGTALLNQYKKVVKTNKDYYKQNYIDFYTGLSDEDDRLDLAKYSCNSDRQNCTYYFIEAINNEFVADNSLEYFSFLVKSSSNDTVLKAAKTIFTKCRAIESKALFDFYEKVVILSGPTDETAVAIVTKGLTRDDDMAARFLDVVKRNPAIYAKNEVVYNSIANLIVKTENAKLKQAAIAVYEQWRSSRQLLTTAAAPAATLAATPAAVVPSVPLATTTVEPAKLDFKIVKSGVSNRNGVAVIIGNRNYAGKGKNIPNVDYAHNDAELMKRYVVETLGFDPANVIFIKDATQADMISIFGSPGDHRGKLNNWTKKGLSDIVVFYSGHGAPSLRDGKGYILPVDADPMTIELNGYKLDLFYDNLAKIEGRSKTVIIDACFSGASQSGSVITSASSIALREKVEPEQIVDNTTIITASGPEEIASWDNSLRTGLLTGHYLRGLSGDADSSEFGNNDGQITVSEMRAYLESEVSYAARRNYGRDQHPQVYSKDDTVLVRYR